jgi:hypothetical protein
VTHSSISFKNGGSFEENASDFGFIADSSAMYAASRDDTQNKAEQIKENGSDVDEVITAVAKCLTHDVSIGHLKRIKFTRDFIFNLVFLNRTLEKGESDQLKAYSHFTASFGTHFIRKAEMGATMSYKKVFTASSESNSDRKIRADCFTLSAERCFMSGDFVEAIAKSCISSKSKLCSRSSSQDADDADDILITIVTRGSTPKGNLQEWFDSEFESYPALVTLEPLVDLITQYNLEASEKYGIPETLDYEGLRRLLTKGNMLYCSEVLKCGPNFPLPGVYGPSKCDPKSDNFCCSEFGYCGNTPVHCDCSTCVNYRRG